MIVILVVAVCKGQAPVAAIVYVTVYAAAELVDGVISPDVELSVNPKGEVNVPPNVPVRLTFCGVEKLVQ